VTAIRLTVRTLLGRWYPGRAVDTDKEVGDVDHLKLFATPEAADEWFKENNPDDVVFEVIDRHKKRWGEYFGPAGLASEEKPAGADQRVSYCQSIHKRCRRPVQAAIAIARAAIRS